MKKIFEIHKLGGSNLIKLSRLDLLKHINYIINNAKENNSKIIFVISALANVTRILDTLFEFWKREDHGAKSCLFSHLKELHLQSLIKFQLEEIKPQLEEYFKKIEIKLNKKVKNQNTTKDQAQIQVFGEMISSFIFFEFLKKNFPEMEYFLGDSTSFIKTDIEVEDSYIKAQPDIKTSVKKIKTFFNLNSEAYNVFIFQGFIASNQNENHDYVTMGYDSSDLSASIYALGCSVLGEANLAYWKDVKGVLRDPKNREDYFSEMSYQEFFDFSQENSTPILSSSLQVIQGSKIPVRVRSFLDLSNEGTIIC